MPVSIRDEIRFSVFNPVSASLTHPLNLVPSLWMSHTVSQPMVASSVVDKMMVVGNLMVVSLVVDKVGNLTTVVRFRMGNSGKLVVGSLQAQA